MSDSADKTLEILIKTKADLAAAKAAQAQLERQIFNNKLLGKSNADQEAQLKTLQNHIEAYTDANKDAGKETEEHHGKILGINLEYGEQRRLMGAITKQFGPMLEAARAFINPLTGGVGLAIGLFSEAKARLAEWNKEMDEAAASMAERYGNLAETIQTANRKIASSAAEAASAVHKIEEAQKSVKDKIDEVTESIKRQEESFIAINDAQEAFELARNEAQRKSGAISDDQANVNEFQIKARAEAARNSAKDTAERGLATQKASELDNASLERHRMQEIVDIMALGEARRQGKIDNIPAEIDKLKKDRDKKDEEITQERPNYDDAHRDAVDYEQTYDKHNPDQVAVLNSFKQIEAQEKAKLDELQSQKDSISRAITQTEAKKSKLETDQKIFEDAKKSVKELDEKIRDLGEQFKRLTEDAKANSETRTKVAAIHQNTEFVTHPFGEVDPKTGLPKTPTPIVPPKPATTKMLPLHDTAMSEEEIQARGGIPAEITRARRAAEAAEKQQREVAKSTADVAEIFTQLVTTVTTGYGNLGSEIKKANEKIADLNSRVKNILNK